MKLWNRLWDSWTHYLAHMANVSWRYRTLYTLDTWGHWLHLPAWVVCNRFDAMVLGKDSSDEQDDDPGVIFSPGPKRDCCDSYYGTGHQGTCPNSLMMGGPGV